MQKNFLRFEFFNTVVQKISFGVQKKTIDLEFVVSYGIYSCQIYCCLPWSHHLPQLLAAGRAVVHPDRREATRTTPALAVPAGSSCWRRMMMQ